MNSTFSIVSMPIKNPSTNSLNKRSTRFGQASTRLKQPVSCLKTSAMTKKVFVHLAKNGGGARDYVEKAGMVQISDPAILIPIIHQVFADNEATVADFKSGKRNADKAFTGFLMKATKGQANPQVALKLLAQELAKLKEN